MVDRRKLVDRFIQYVRIDSESGYEKEICDVLYDQLQALDVKVDKLNEDNTFSNGYNMIGRIPGSIQAEPVFLAAHMDTVVNGRNIQVVENNGILSSDGTTILGADDKIALAVIMEVLDIIKTNNIPTRPFEIVFTLCEEQGLKGAKALDVNEIQANDGFVLDGTGAIGGIDICSPNHVSIKVDVKGKCAHSGSGACQGVSAIQIASRAIADLYLGTVDEYTTCNVGIIHGGEALNIVPDHCHVEAAVRSTNALSSKKQIEHIKDRFKFWAKSLDGYADINIDTSYDGVNQEKNNPLIKNLQRAFELNDIQPYFKNAGGGSDNNIFFNRGKNSIDLSIAYKNIHTVNESVEIVEMERLAKTLLTYLQLED